MLGARSLLNSLKRSGVNSETVYSGKNMNANFCKRATPFLIFPRSGVCRWGRYRFMLESSERWRVEQSERQFIEEAKAAAAVRYEFFIGVDVGKLQDRSAVAVIERQTKRTPQGDSIQTALRGLYAIPPKVSYTTQAEGIESLLLSPCFQLWRPSTLIDASGAGEALCDLLDERKKVKFKRVNITSGDAVTAKRGRIYASRNQLISTLTKLLRREGFAISADLPLLQELLKELAALGEESTKAGGVVYRTSGHDDFLMAFALAALALHRKDAGPRTGVTTLF